MANCCRQSRNGQQHFIRNEKSCNDLFWICLFIVFWIVLGTIASFAIIDENYLAIINGYDSFGNTCGVNSNKHFNNFSLSATDTSNKTYVLFFNPVSPPDGIQICIEECPWAHMYAPEDIYEHSQTIGAQMCRYDFDMQILITQPISPDYSDPLGPCPGIIVESSIPIRQRCIHLMGLTRPIGMLRDISSAGGIVLLSFVYIYLGRFYIAALCGIAFVISVILLIMMRWLAKFFPRLICILVLLGNASLCAVLWFIYETIPVHDPEDIFHIEVQLMEEFVLNKKSVFYFAILSSVTMGALVFAIVFWCREIISTSELFEETAICLVKLPPSLLTNPLISLAILIGFFWLWSFVMVCVTTATYPEVVPFKNTATHNIWIHEVDDSLRFFQKIVYVENEWIRKSFWVFIVAFLWTTEFISACEQFSVGTIIAYCYFRRPLQTPSISVTNILFKYHLGTVVKGSIFIPLFRIPRLAITYLNRKYGISAEYKRFQFVKTFLGIMERYLRLLTTNAYIVAAMETIDLISAGKVARKTMANGRELENVNRAGGFVLFLLKVFIATVTSLIGVFLLRTDNDMYFYMAPLLLSAVFGYLIAHTVLSLFEMTMDSLVLCICEDKHLNGDSGLWAQNRLAKFLGTELARSNKVCIATVQVAER